LTGIVVAPITRTVRRIATEIALGPDEGLCVECVASFDNLQRIRRSTLTQRAGELGVRSSELCTALRTLADC
jgi:mRNA interferase MazF